MSLEPLRNALTFKALDAKWQDVRGVLPDKLRLRMRRALSWLERAEKEKDDYDAAFIFYWIAFNAAYATDRRQDPDTIERSNFSEYFESILGLDVDGTIYDAIYQRFSGPIRVLLDNQYVFQPFWDHRSGLGHDNWEFQFAVRRREALKALLDQDTRFILSAVFDRLYVLRNQLIHGGATWNGSVNRDQVRDGARIMAFLVPLFIDRMMDNPGVDWGPPYYPVVD